MSAEDPQDTTATAAKESPLRKALTEKVTVDAVIDLYVDWPCTCFWSCCVFQLVLATVSILTGSMAIEQRDGAWDIFSQPNTQYHIAFKNAQDSADRLPYDNTSRRLLLNMDDHGTDLDSELQWPSASAGDAKDLSHWMGHPSSLERRLADDDGEKQFYFLYKSNLAGTGNIFESANLQSMCNLEKVVMTSHGGRSARIKSPVLLAYGFGAGNPEAWECSLLPQATIDAFVNLMWADVKAQTTQSQYARYVHPSFVSTGTTAYTRSEIKVTQPDEARWEEAVLTKVGTSYAFRKSGYQGDADDRFLTYEGLRVRYWFDAVDEFDKMVGPDFIMAFASVIFVYIIMYVYLKSFWLSSWAMYQIMCSLPIGAFFYKHVFQINYFEFLHVLIVYLMLGIGADDIFVFIDAFKNISREYPLALGSSYSRADLHIIMKRTCLRAGAAIFNTSITTTIAFLACSVSEVMPMRTCGWYAAACIVTVYISTMVFAPATLIIYHRIFQGTRCCCPPCRSRPEAQPAVSDQAIDKVKSIHEELGCFAKFFENYYIPFMSKKVGPVRLGALSVCMISLGVAIQGIYFTTQLTPPRKAEVWFPSTHMLSEFSEFISNHYYSPDYDDYATVNIFWGIKELDLTGFDPYYPDKLSGGVNYDTAFDLSTKEAQDHVLDVCEQLQTAPCNLAGCINPGYGTLMMQTKFQTHSCFLADMKAELNGTLPQGPAFLIALKNFRYGKTQEKYGSPALDANYQGMIGMMGSELKFVGVRIRATFRKEEAHQKGTAVRDLVKGLVGKWKATAPSSMKSIKYDASGVFSGFDLGSQLLSGFFSGISIAMPAAFGVLLFATRNIVLSTYAVVSVAFIVCCVLGFCKSAMDWDMGTGEAIAGIIVIGYSVDFCVHLAHMYHEADRYGHHDRDARCQFAIRNLGTTIFAGALTTSGAGVPMFFCFFYFFFKMALLITITIMYSLIFSIGFFMSVLWLIGPNGNFGELCNCCATRDSGCMKVFPAAQKKNDEGTHATQGHVSPDSQKKNDGDASVTKGITPPDAQNPNDGVTEVTEMA